MKNAVKRVICILLLLFVFTHTNKAMAQNTSPSGQTTQEEQAVVTQVKEQKKVKVEGHYQTYQKLELQVLSGSQKGKTITVVNGLLAQANPVVYAKGDTVIVTVSSMAGGKQFTYISDFVRTTPLYLLFAIFLILAIVVGRLRGLSSLVGMGVSFLAIFNFVIPQILAGTNPIFAVVLTSLFIVPVTFYISHGLNKKTTAAVIGTIITIVITGVLAGVFVNFAHLTGTASEEAAYVTQIQQGAIDLRALLTAGILIAALGILNDITVSQAAIVSELKATAQHLSFGDVYSKAMNIGRDHIASMINTLILVYAGAALPLLLLFVNNPHPAAQVINYEIVAEEVVRTLVASVGLILAVPITTVIAALFYS